jgi:hypothetical protein
MTVNIAYGHLLSRKLTDRTQYSYYRTVSSESQPESDCNYNCRDPWIIQPVRIKKDKISTFKKEAVDPLKR